MEAQFSTCGITSQKTKYEYVIASLSPELTTQIPEATHYDSTNSRLSSGSQTRSYVAFFAKHTLTICSLPVRTSPEQHQDHLRQVLQRLSNVRRQGHSHLELSHIHITLQTV